MWSLEPGSWEAKKMRRTRAQLGNTQGGVSPKITFLIEKEGTGTAVQNYLYSMFYFQELLCHEIEGFTMSI